MTAIGTSSSSATTRSTAAILVNELLSSVFLDYLKIAAPETALLHVTRDVPRRQPGRPPDPRHAPPRGRARLAFRLPLPRRPRPHRRLRFPARCPAAPVVNLEDFRGILVFDKWAGNADGRQSVFYRAKVRVGPRRGAARLRRAHDRPRLRLQRPNWDFPDSPLQGLYARRLVYERVRSLDDFQPWLDQVQHFPEEVIDQAWKRIPPDWIDGEEEALERLLERLSSVAGLCPS